MMYLHDIPVFTSGLSLKGKADWGALTSWNIAYLKLT